jgi:RNA binding exosome subunit
VGLANSVLHIDRILKKLPDGIQVSEFQAMVQELENRVDDEMSLALGCVQPFV